MADKAPRIGQQHTAESLAHLASVVAGQDLRFTDAALTEAAERFSDGILQAWHDIVRGVESLNLSHPTVRLALAWLQAPPHNIPRPDLAIRWRSSESYFILYAYTGTGSFVIERLNKCFPGLKYKRQFRDFEVQRFIRELSTKGTRLGDSMWLVGHCLRFQVRFEVTEMMAIVLLMRRNRKLSTRSIQREVRDFFGPGMDDIIEAILRQEEMEFDNDFLVTGTNSRGSLIHSLPSGHENLLLKRLYGPSPVAYVEDTIEWLLLLSDQLKVKVLRSVLNLGTTVHVQLDPSGQYNFAVFGPHDDPSGPLPAFRIGQIGPVVKLFAIAETNSQFRDLALQIFYGDNSFVLGPFPYLEHQPDLYLYHLGHWKNAIGERACSYLRENVSEG